MRKTKKNAIHKITKGKLQNLILPHDRNENPTVMEHKRYKQDGGTQD